MLNKNTMVTGILAGLLLPLISVLIFELALTNLVINGKRGMQYLIVVGLNLFWLKFFAKKGSDKAAQGVIIITFAFMLLVFLFRFKA